MQSSPGGQPPLHSGYVLPQADAGGAVVVVVDVVVVPVVLVVDIVGIVVSPTGVHTHAFGCATQVSPGGHSPSHVGCDCPQDNRGSVVVEVLVVVELVVVVVAPEADVSANDLVRTQLCIPSTSPNSLIVRSKLLDQTVGSVLRLLES